MSGEFHNPYEESKVKSEHLVYSYQEQLDVSIFRPSIIVGDSKTGEADSEFTLYGFMRALAVFKRKTARRSGEEKIYRLNVSDNGTSNLVPVDYVSDILSLAPEKAQRNKIYHITNPNPPGNMEILGMIKEALGFENLSVVENTGTCQLDEAEVKLNSLIEVFKVYLAGALTFEDGNTQELIAGTTVSHLKMSREMTEMIIHAGCNSERKAVV